MADSVITPPTALELAARQRDISVSEFFLKNRHLLGFDSPSKAVVTTVKEAVDNALDACEEAGIVPEIRVEVAQDGDLCRVAVEDNGPGIVERQIARIFGKLLYGSKFHKLSQSRGQQGMGISAAGMYAQLTAGKPMHIVSRVAGEEKAWEMLVSIDTSRNRPDIHRKRRIRWDRPHGTRVEVDLEGRHQTGPHSVETYLRLTAIANPHVTLHYLGPDGETIRFERIVDALPPRPREIKPHPHGVELGRLIQMLSDTKSRTLLHFLEEEFARVGRKTALEIIERAGAALSARSYPKRIAHAQAARLHRAIGRTRISAPRTDCLVPIGEDRLLDGLRKELKAGFYTVVTRPAAVYRGNPFQVEIGIAYGGPGRTSAESGKDHGFRPTKDDANGTPEEPGTEADEPARLLRYANRVPLLYQQGACAITRAAVQTNWRAYGLQQPKGALPVAPMAIVAHVASVWVPFTSESKEAVAAYPEILKELRLGIQQCGRRLAAHLSHQKSLRRESQRRARIEKYLPHIGVALQDILVLSDADRDRDVAALHEILQHKRGG